MWKKNIVVVMRDFSLLAKWTNSQRNFTQLTKDSQENDQICLRVFGLSSILLKMNSFSMKKKGNERKTKIFNWINCRWNVYDKTWKFVCHLFFFPSVYVAFPKVVQNEQNCNCFYLHLSVETKKTKPFWDKLWMYCQK